MFQNRYKRVPFLAGVVTLAILTVLSFTLMSSSSASAANAEAPACNGVGSVGAGGNGSNTVNVNYTLTVTCNQTMQHIYLVGLVSGTNLNLPVNYTCVNTNVCEVKGFTSAFVAPGAFYSYSASAGGSFDY